MTNEDKKFNFRKKPFRKYFWSNIFIKINLLPGKNASKNIDN